MSSTMAVPGAPPPPTLLMGPSPMAVGTPHVALGDLALDGAEAVAASGQGRYCRNFGGGVAVIELQDEGVCFTAVHAGVFE